MRGAGNDNNDKPTLGQVDSSSHALSPNTTNTHSFVQSRLVFDELTVNGIDRRT